MLKTLCLSGFILLFALLAFSPTQANDCDHSIPLTTWKVDGMDDNIQPGDIVCLQSGTRGKLRLEDLTGTAENPIIIQNSGGQLFVETNYSISVARSQHIRLTGTGDSNHKYGIKAAGTVYVGELTTNVEVDHLEIYNPDPQGFSGMMVKTDPSCDPATWRENFTMYDVSLHDNYIHNITHGEGFYIGFTFYDGYERTCDGQTITVYGHTIEGLEVYNNILEDTACEAIQISSIPNGAHVYSNVIRLYGQRPFANYQDNGVQIGEGNAVVYNNLIDTGNNIAFILFGTGHKLYNNIILNSGQDGIFSDDRREGNGNIYVNNTIINPGRDGIRIYNDEAVTTNIIKNNIIVKADNDNAFVRVLNDKVPLDMSHNLTDFDVSSVGFVDSTHADYRLLFMSPAVNAGVDVSALGVTFDYARTPRPQDSLFDQGAYEYKPRLTLFAQALDRAIKLTWHVDTIPSEATWTITVEGSTAYLPSPITGLPVETRAYTLTGLSNHTLYNITLNAVVSASPILTDTVSARPTDIFVYLPLITR